MVSDLDLSSATAGYIMTILFWVFIGLAAYILFSAVFCCMLSMPDFFCIVLALVFPPIPVILKRGLFTTDFLLNFLLTMLGYLPGLVHAILIIGWYPSTRERVVYIREVVTDIPAERSQPPQPQLNHNYGSTSQRNDSKGPPPPYQV